MIGHKKYNQQIFGIIEMINEPDTEIRIGDVVWGKAINEPIWPAIVVEQQDDDIYKVQFINEKTEAYLRRQDIFKFQQNCSKFRHTERGSKVFQQALKQALQWVEFQKEANLGLKNQKKSAITNKPPKKSQKAFFFGKKKTQRKPAKKNPTAKTVLKHKSIQKKRNPRKTVQYPLKEKEVQESKAQFSYSQQQQVPNQEAKESEQHEEKSLSVHEEKSSSVHEENHQDRSKSQQQSIHQSESVSSNKSQQRSVQHSKSHSSSKSEKKSIQNQEINHSSNKSESRYEQKMSHSSNQFQSKSEHNMNNSSSNNCDNSNNEKVQQLDINQQSDEQIDQVSVESNDHILSQEQSQSEQDHQEKQADKNEQIQTKEKSEIHAANLPLLPEKNNEVSSLQSNLQPASPLQPQRDIFSELRNCLKTLLRKQSPRVDCRIRKAIKLLRDPRVTAADLLHTKLSNFLARALIKLQKDLQIDRESIEELEEQFNRKNQELTRTFNDLNVEDEDSQ